MRNAVAANAVTGARVPFALGAGDLDEAAATGIVATVPDLGHATVEIGPRVQERAAFLERVELPVLDAALAPDRVAVAVAPFCEIPKGLRRSSTRLPMILGQAILPLRCGLVIRIMASSNLWWRLSRIWPGGKSPFMGAPEASNIVD